MTETELLLGALAFAMAGILKGATGGGAPIVAVPVLALMHGVPFAVAVFTLPNLLSNSYQSWLYRRHLPSRRFPAKLAVAGAVGALLGTFILVWVPSRYLMLGVACMVFVYIGFRLARPDWSLARPVAERLAFPVGTLGGMLQGASGISAPVSMTFLNAMRLERGEFIGTISIFFVAMSLTQIPTLWAFGELTPERMALGLGALVPMFAAMPVGAWLARQISRAAFDRLIMALLVLIALRLIYNVFF